MYDLREKGVDQAERRRRAGEMYAYTTGEFLRDLRAEQPEVALEIERAEHHALTLLEYGVRDGRKRGRTNAKPSPESGV